MSTSLQYDKEAFEQAFKKDMAFFKKAFPDFVDFDNPGDEYLSRERNYKLEAVKEATTILSAYRDGKSNPLETFLQWTKLANFFDWRMVDKTMKLEQQDFLSKGLETLYDGISNNTQPSVVFNSIADTLFKAKMSAGMFLQTILYSFFLKFPDRYFGLNTRPLQRKLKQYGFTAYKQGHFITWEQFQTIQEFGQQLRVQLAPYKPKDMIDVQSFLYVTGDYEINSEVFPNADNATQKSSNPTEDVVENVEKSPGLSYTIDDIIQDGCFLDQDDIEKILRRLKDKKNLVLQGPPRTGKTWLAKRLAYALIGQKDKNKVRPVQFHPGMSYEDFIRGYRPNPEGKLDLVDGPFVKMCEKARGASDSSHVVVIEEINRGNPAQIFGEMLTLIEADKRNEDEEILLSYGDDPFHIPENLYIIGTMNLADRSLALVDFALRRRFAFVDLEPSFGNTWREWVQKAGIIKVDLKDLESRITKVNEEIAGNANLGKQFCIGHSYFTPPPEPKYKDAEERSSQIEETEIRPLQIKNAKEWFRQIVETEVGPLLDEYLYDNPTEADRLKKVLLENL